MPHARCSRPFVSSRRGFTLVELLVVIGIIALLMSILLPTLGRVKEQANATKCASNLRQLATAFQMYASENKGRLPVRNASRGLGPQKWDWIAWQQLPTPRDFTEGCVVKYLGSNASIMNLQCPSDENAAVRPLNGNAASVGPYIFSYTVNVLIMLNEDLNSTSKYARSLNVGSVRNSTEKILCVEEDERTINDGSWVGQPSSGVAGTAPANDFLSIRHSRQRFMPDDVANWERNADKSGNAGFLDGHVEFVTRRFAHDLQHLDPGK